MSNDRLNIYKRWESPLGVPRGTRRHFRIEGCKRTYKDRTPMVISQVSTLEKAQEKAADLKAEWDEITITDLRTGEKVPV